MLQGWISDREKTMPTSINTSAGRYLTFVEFFFFLLSLMITMLDHVQFLSNRRSLEGQSNENIK
jgi:hypothetical protein